MVSEIFNKKVKYDKFNIQSNNLPDGVVILIIKFNLINSYK